jgi:hypothetical protein
MLQAPTLPASLAGLLAAFGSCFTAPTFATFCALLGGMVAQTGRRTVCGMLTGAGLHQVWGHDRAHRFFSAARWSADQVGLAVARLVVDRLLPSGAALTVAVDDTLFRRWGRKVHAAVWTHDGSAQGPSKVGFGNRWVVVGIVVWLPVVTRPVCLPVLARLWAGKGTASHVELARELLGLLSRAFPDRPIHAVGDAAYHGPALRDLPQRVTVTTRLPANAALFDLAPPRTGKRGRPRVKGGKLGTAADLAATAAFTKTTVERYGRTDTVYLATVTCLWYGVFRARTVRVVLLREADTTRSRGYDLALVTTDTDAPPQQVISRYAARWSVEVAIFDSKQTFGVGQARNRTPNAVRRTVPFGLCALTLTIVWYALHGHHPDDVAHHRARAPWYLTKTDPSVADMAAKLRRTLIAAQYLPSSPHQPSPEEITAVHLAWAAAAA